MSSQTSRSGLTASPTFWMIGLSILLFWMLVAGPFIAGLVGGRKAGTLKLLKLPEKVRFKPVSPYLLVVSDVAEQTVGVAAYQRM